MLSKVVRARDGGRTQPFEFPSVAAAPAPRNRPAAPRELSGAAEQELVSLRQRIGQLEQEIVTARKEGVEAGRQQGHAEVVPVLERMKASIAEMVGMRQQLRGQAEKDVVQLALLIGRRVLHRELAIDPNALTALARTALERLSRAETCRIVVHPQFADAIAAALPAGQPGRLRIEADASCAPGTLVFHSNDGVVDASIDAQLEEINRGLADRLAIA